MTTVNAYIITVIGLNDTQSLSPVGDGIIITNIYQLSITDHLKRIFCSPVAHELNSYVVDKSTVFHTKVVEDIIYIGSYPSRKLNGLRITTVQSFDLGSHQL